MKTLLCAFVSLFLVFTAEAQTPTRAEVAALEKTAFLGISMDNSGGDGARVAQVMPDSPAAGAGLKEGDVIVKIAGFPVRGVISRITEMVRAKKPGDKIDILWSRGEIIGIAEVTLGSRANAVAAGKALSERIREERVKMTEKHEQSKRRIDDLAVTPFENGGTERKHVEEEIQKLETQANELLQRAAKLRATLRGSPGPR
jgi:C-terminal processing protease CtpA/Prc